MLQIVKPGAVAGQAKDEKARMLAALLAARFQHSAVGCIRTTGEENDVYKTQMYMRVVLHLQRQLRSKATR